MGRQRCGEKEYGPGALFPLFVGDDLTGFMFLMKDRAIEAQEVECLEVFALQAASIIRSARLFYEIERLRDHLALENAYLEEVVREEAGFADIVGTSPVLQDVLRLIRQVAPTDSTVLLCGETGTGKELVARAIHGASRRADHPIIKVNCGGLSSGLVDSELFGHERGAFTGATQRRIGRFELADGGTLFLDEVAELPGETQVKLLRVLQEREFERVGGERTLRVDVRLIAATHRNLDEEVAAGTLSLRPLLPPQRVSHRHPAPAGAAGGHRAARAALRRALRPPSGEAIDRDFAGELCATEPLPLAGQHPRAAKRDRAGLCPRRRSRGGRPRTGARCDSGRLVASGDARGRGAGPHSPNAEAHRLAGGGRRRRGRAARPQTEHAALTVAEAGNPAVGSLTFDGPGVIHSSLSSNPG